jgi:hypothetical protein
MTPEETIDRAQLMMKWAESVRAGKPMKIQCRRIGTTIWTDIQDSPEWCGSSEYREKPKPREFWAVTSTGSQLSKGHIYITKEDALKSLPLTCPFRVREVEEMP